MFHLGPGQARLRFLAKSKDGAGDEIRTRNLDLGKVLPYHWATPACCPSVEDHTPDRQGRLELTGKTQRSRAPELELGLRPGDLPFTIYDLRFLERVARIELA